ncbi:type IV secretory system conjugative DNA transfer family protein [Enterococcus sp. AZ196]|uniref:type IV secretory system conjugative DNA transfer family protein n=1 Tax=Enterococcus sp. AZ196 TaxID=2774659 RepID=UPI003D27F1E1
MSNDPFSDGLFSYGTPQKKPDKEPKSKFRQLLMGMILFGFVLYPFLIVGLIPLLIVQRIDRKDQQKYIYDMDYVNIIKRYNNHFFVLSFVLAVVNMALFTLVIPRGYLSCYILFPLNNLNHVLTFGPQTIVALAVGGLGMGSILIAYSGFVAKRKVYSKERRQKDIIESKEYQKRLANKFEESQKYVKEYENEYQVSIVIKDLVVRKERLSELSKTILLGTDEYGLPYKMGFRELNQHALIPATTGGGKTTLIQVFIEHCIKYGIPVLLIDGKGARDTLTAMEDIAAKYGKKVRSFTDTGTMRYNPIKYGNDISIRDKLANLAETESVYYSMASKALLQVTVQLLDEFSKTHEIERSLPFMQKYLIPREVLNLFIDRLSERNPQFFDLEIQLDSGPKKNKNVGSDANQETDSNKASNRHSKYKKSEAKVENSKTVILDPEKLSLEDLYSLIKRSMDAMTEDEKKLFERLFVRYEHKDNPFYLYATSEALQTNINMLLDSELGKLFDTKGSENTLDLKEIASNGDVVYVSLNGLIYKDFIVTLAQMLVGEVNFFASDLYAKSERIDFLTIFDEPASYLNDSFIDSVNKGRGAGLHAIYSPQTMADIDKLGDKLKEQLVGNVNTFIVGKTNETSEVNYWSETFGTYQDIEVTDVVNQEEGYSDAGNISWQGEKGTRRDVDRFNFHPNRFRNLRQGEFAVYRTALNVHEVPRAVYMRNPIAYIKKEQANESKVAERHSN